MSEFSMCAGAMKMLLHYYTSPDPQEYRGNGNEQFDSECRVFLANHGLIFTTTGWVRSEISCKGRAYVEMVLNTPLPVQRWVHP